MQLFNLLLRFPVFLYIFGVLHWSAALCGLLYKIPWLQFKGKRNDVLGWALAMKALVRFKVLKVGDSELFRGNCVYLINHRSWADMMIDQYATEGRALFMSRLAVVFAFPQLLTTMAAMRTILLFKRGSIADKDGFNKWIDRKLEESPQAALVVYPEGHRNTTGESLLLKRGMLYYAYSRRLPVQIIIGRNKEAILSEKGLVTRLGQTVAVGYSDVIEPSQYGCIEAFIADVQKTWDAQWQQVFTAKLRGLPELRPGPPDFDYPLSIRAALAVLIPLNILMLLATFYYALRWAATALALCGPLRVPALLLCVAWVGASFLQAAKPVQVLELQESMRAGKARVAAGAAKKE